MGFLQRLFSIRSKSKSRSRKSKHIHNDPLVETPEYQYEASVMSRSSPAPVPDEDHEEAIGRLLRSNSSRYAVHAEVDFTDLPPLPHPINSVVNLRSPSLVSLASSTFGSRSNYNVTVLPRERQPSGESQLYIHETPKRTACRDSALLNANANANGLLRLRSDPSVVSLVSLYDDHGYLPDAAFSNTPPASPEKQPQEKVERAQCKRSGSTLRMLLGAPTGGSVNSKGSDTSGEEGDISWAERFLDEAVSETETMSSRSSVALAPPISRNGNVSIASAATDTTVDNPSLSSMNVELSVASDGSIIFNESFAANPGNSPYKCTNPDTPQRASQVFSFITKRKQSKLVGQDERPLPTPPTDDLPVGSRNSAIFIPEDTPRATRRPSDHSVNTRYGGGDVGALEAIAKRLSFNNEATIRIDVTATPRPNRDLPLASYQTMLKTGDDESPMSTPQQSTTRPVRVLMTGPTSVIVTAPTPSSAQSNTPSRIPRGPRAHREHAKRRASGSHRSESERHRRAQAYVQRSYTGDMLATTQRDERRSQRRSPSVLSSGSANDENENPSAAYYSQQYQQSHQPSRRESRSKKDKDSSSVRSRNGRREKFAQFVMTGSAIPEDYISKPFRRSSSRTQMHAEGLDVCPDMPLTPLRSHNTNEISEPHRRPSSRTSDASHSRSRGLVNRVSVNRGMFEPPSVHFTGEDVDSRQYRSRTRAY